MEHIIDFLKWLETTTVAEFIVELGWSFQLALMIHLTGITIVFGMIAVVDLRLMGLASNRWAVTDILRQALPWTWWAFACTVASGLFLFMAQPQKYFENFAFQMKFLLMAVAGLNMLVFHFLIYRSVEKWDSDTAVPFTAKFAGAISLVCWTAAVGYGRWTAYYQL